MRYLVTFINASGQPDELVIDAHTPHSAIEKIRARYTGRLTFLRVYTEEEF